MLKTNEPVCILRTFNDTPSYIFLTTKILILIICKLTIFDNMRVWDHTVMLSGSTYTIWQFIVFLVLLWSNPDDGIRSDRNILVIGNMWRTVLRTWAFVGFITQVWIFLFARVWNINTPYCFDLPAECWFKGWHCF